MRVVLLNNIIITTDIESLITINTEIRKSEECINSDWACENQSYPYTGKVLMNSLWNAA